MTIYYYRNTCNNQHSANINVIVKQVYNRMTKYCTGCMILMSNRTIRQGTTSRQSNHGLVKSHR